MPNIWMIDYNFEFWAIFYLNNDFLFQIYLSGWFSRMNTVYFRHLKHPLLVHFYSEFHYDVIIMMSPWRHYIQSDGHGGEFQFLQIGYVPFQSNHTVYHHLYTPPFEFKFIFELSNQISKKFKKSNKTVISALQKSHFISAALQNRVFYRLPRW